MKNIFAIIYCFPPILVPATVRYLKWFTGLGELGYKIDALSIDPNSFESPAAGLKDDTLVRLVPNGIVNHIVWSWEKNPILRTIKKTKLGYTLFYRFLEPRKMEWYYPAIKYLSKLNMDAFDVMLSCSQPHSCHLVGLFLKQKTGKPWVAYFSDPWADNPYASYHSKKIYDYNAGMEKDVIENADAVLFTTEETFNLVAKKYPEEFAKKMHLIPHSFVPEWYELSKGYGFERKGEKIRMVHTGHFYGHRTPMPLFETLLRLRKEIKDISERIEFLFFGNMDQKYQDFIIDNRLGDLIKIYGTIPYIQSLGLIKNADYLLLIDAPLINTSESVFLPSKLIDYIGSYNHVIGITPAKGASASVLRKTGNLVCDVHDTDSIYETFKSIIEGTLSVNPDRERIDRYHYKRITQEFSDIVEQIQG